jgi:nicotinate-nucleotide adenylyltransferase
MSEDQALEETFKHIAILGGSFDPPTIAHIQTASEIYNLVGEIDEVWLVPCGDNRKDKALKASARQRKEMLELAIKDILDENFPNIKVCDFEIEYGSYLPTYDLLCKLKEKYPLNKFYMSIGSDLVEGL